MKAGRSIMSNGSINPGKPKFTTAVMCVVTYLYVMLYLVFSIAIESGYQHCTSLKRDYVSEAS